MSPPALLLSLLALHSAHLVSAKRIRDSSPTTNVDGAEDTAEAPPPVNYSLPMSHPDRNLVPRQWFGDVEAFESHDWPLMADSGEQPPPKKASKKKGRRRQVTRRTRERSTERCCKCVYPDNTIRHVFAADRRCEGCWVDDVGAEIEPRRLKPRPGARCKDEKDEDKTACCEDLWKRDVPAERSREHNEEDEEEYEVGPEVGADEESEVWPEVGQAITEDQEDEAAEAQEPSQARVGSDSDEHEEQDEAQGQGGDDELHVAEDLSKFVVDGFED